MGKASNSKTENKRQSHHEKRVHWIKPVNTLAFYSTFCLLLLS